MNVVQARKLPLECRQLRGSQQHLRSPSSHLPDLLSQIQIVFVLNQCNGAQIKMKKETQGTTPFSNVLKLLFWEFFHFAKQISSGF